MSFFGKHFGPFREWGTTLGRIIDQRKAYHTTLQGKKEWGHDDAMTHRQTRQLREAEEKYLTNKNLISSLFNPKSFLKGWSALKDTENKGLLNSLTKDEKIAINKFISDDEANVYIKAKMNKLIAEDILNATKPISPKEVAEDEESQVYRRPSSLAGVYGRGNDSGESDDYFDKLTLDQRDTYLNLANQYGDDYAKDFAQAQVNVREHYKKGNKEPFEKVFTKIPKFDKATEDLRKYATDVIKYNDELMKSMLESSGGQLDQDKVKQIEINLNSQYDTMIKLGENEANEYNLPLSQDEIVAHGRYETHMPKDDSWYGSWYKSANATATEKNIRFNSDDEQSMYTFIQQETSNLYKQDIDDYKSQRGYNADQEIADMLNVASDNLLESVDVKNGKSVYKFRNLDDDADAFVGLKGFNEWRKQGYLDELLQNKEELEKLAVTYKVLEQKQGEDAAKNWLQERLQHYASEGISGWDQAYNSTIGFFKDIMGDAVEIVGGAWGITTGLTEGLWNSAFSDDSLSQVWTDAIGQAFDNRVTRWGSDLSTTGYFDYEKQNKAVELGLSVEDNIIDPEHADRFLFKGGGTGVGYFLGETGRQASHTMFAVWSGRILATPFGRVGATVVRMLGGTKSAMKVGYRIGSTIGLAVAGSNEGIMDGIQVKRDVYNQGMQQVEQEMANRAIADTVNTFNNMDDLALAKFLQQNHVGDQQVQDENGNITIQNNLIQRNEQGQLVATLDREQMIDLLKNSEYGKQLIEKYKNREDVAEEYKQMEREVNNSAIRNGAATATIENFINGSIRSHNAGARANIKGAEREFKKRLAATTINKQGEVAIKDVGVKFALKQSLSNAKHEAVEEGLQTITQTTFTAVGNNSIKRYIDKTYDTNTWEGFFKEYGAVAKDVVTNAGAGVFKQETYEAAVQGAIGSLMGFGNFKKANTRLGFKFTWEGSVFNINSTIRQENQMRKDMAQALQQSINKEGGLRTLLSMAQTKQSLDTYNNAVQNNAENIYQNKELAVGSLIHNASTLAQIKDTEFGQMIMSNLVYQSEILQNDFENSEMSQNEIDKARRERAKEFLTYKPETEELDAKKKAALKEVQEWIKKSGGNVRSIEEIAEKPTDAEADALVDIVTTARQSREFVDRVTDINESNSKNVPGLNFVARNELNVKTLLVEDQEKRLKNIDSRLANVAQQNSPKSNTTLSAEQKQSIAVLGNSDEQRNKSKKAYEDRQTEAKENLKKIKSDLKSARKELRRALVQNQYALVQRYSMQIQALEDNEAVLKGIIKETKSNLSKDKKSLWDRITGVKEADEIAEHQRVLTSYDILTLSPTERAMMLDPKNKENYSEEQLEEIRNVRHIMAQSHESINLIEQARVLQQEITANNAEIDDILTNIDTYNKHVQDSEKKFRALVLDNRYGKYLDKDMNIDEVNDFVDKLSIDVEQGLISQSEKNQLINRAMDNEAERVKNAKENGSDVVDGWNKYRQINSQDREIGSTFINTNTAIDKSKFDNLMKFLKAARMTIQDFNQLSEQEKRELLNNSEINTALQEGETVDTNGYIQFAAEVLNLYEDAKAKIATTNQDLARGANDGTSAEETVVPVNNENIDDITKEEAEKNKIINYRKKIDNSYIFGSRLNRIINYIKNNGILQDQDYKYSAGQLLDIVTEIANSETPITSIDQLNQMIDDAITDANVRNTWYEVQAVIKRKEQTRQTARISKAWRDTNLDPTNSSTIETQRVSSMRQDETKKPILDFLAEHSYEEATKQASQLSQGSTGLGVAVYYVVNPLTTQRYRTQLGDNYSDSNNLPIFTCINVGKDFEGAIPIKVGDDIIYVAPVGVLDENVEASAKSRGLGYVQAIRNLAIGQVNGANEPVAITVDGTPNGRPIMSAPQNWKNWILPEGNTEYTGRRTLLQEIKGFGEDVKSSINSVIKKLKVGVLANGKKQTYYDNGLPQHRLPIIKKAGLNELYDETQEMTIAEILGGENATLSWQINNPIIHMFYSSILNSDKSFVNLIQSRSHIISLLNAKKIDELNDQVNQILSKSFWIGSYEEEAQWKYEIDVDELIKGNFILRAVPQMEESEDQNSNTTDTKEVVLLNFTKLFDENGNLQLSTVHANTILQNLMFDASGQDRTRTGYGTAFAQVQLGHGVVNHANGIFTKKEEETLSEEQKKEKQKSAHSVLSSLIQGGGLLVEGQIDQSADRIAIKKPDVFDKDKNIISGQNYTPAQAAAISALNELPGHSELSTASETQKEENIGRDRYIGVNELKNKGDNSWRGKTHMWVTAMANWLTGMSWEKRKQRGLEDKSEGNKDITFGVGNNTDLIFRHVLWTSRFNTNISEKEGLKKIPLEDEAGEEYYTDQELENQFGFHASHIKAVAYAFNSFINQLEQQKHYTFVTNVIKPKAIIEVTDKDSGKKYKVPVAGELDMLAIDETGTLHPIDFKTHRFKTKNGLETLRTADPEERETLIRNELGETFETYKRQVNLYQASLDQKKRLRVGDGLLLIVPVEYPNDPSVKMEVRSDSEYKNGTLVSVDSNGKETPYLEGLNLFEAQDDNTGPVQLTTISIPVDKDFQFDKKDIILMAQSDVNFLRNNPEFGELIAELRAENANKSSIEIKLAKQESSESQEEISEVNQGQVVYHRRKKKHKREDSTNGNTEGVTQTQKSETKNLAIGKTQANYDEINSRIQQLESSPLADENADTIEFIVDGESITFTVKQVKDYVASLQEKSQNGKQDVADLFNSLTVEEVCTGINCGG